MNQADPALLALGQEYFGCSPHIANLQGDGSDRVIKRLEAPGQEPVIGVWHLDLEENESFLLVTEAMARLELPVPKVLAVAADRKAYLLEDLGPTTLAQQLTLWDDTGAKAIGAYLQVLGYLPKMQVGLARLLFRHLETRKMDRTQLLGDLDYFEAHFVRLFDHQDRYSKELREELERELIDPVAALPVDRFVYRDFQARNFMWVGEKIYFLDYQSAMLGNKYYDLASMLYASRAGLSDKQRGLLLFHGYQKLAGPDETKEQFAANFYRVLLLRRLRSLGSYGYLGQVKGKPGFLESLPPAITEIQKRIKTQLPRLERLAGFLGGCIGSS